MTFLQLFPSWFFFGFICCLRIKSPKLNVFSSHCSCSLQNIDLCRRLNWDLCLRNVLLKASDMIAFQSSLSLLFSRLVPSSMTTHLLFSQCNAIKCFVFLSMQWLCYSKRREWEYHRSKKGGHKKPRKDHYRVDHKEMDKLLSFTKWIFPKIIRSNHPVCQMDIGQRAVSIKERALKNSFNKSRASLKSLISQKMWPQASEAISTFLKRGTSDFLYKIT